MVELWSRDQMAASDWSRYSHVKLCGTTTLPAAVNTAEDVDNNNDVDNSDNNSTDAGNSTETATEAAEVTVTLSEEELLDVYAVLFNHVNIYCV